VRLLKPEAIIHVADAFIKMEVPQGVAAPILLTFGQKEILMTMARRGKIEFVKRFHFTRYFLIVYQ